MIYMTDRKNLIFRGWWRCEKKRRLQGTVPCNLLFFNWKPKIHMLSTW